MKYLLALLVGVTLLAYLPVRQAGFVYEDSEYLKPALRPMTWGQVFTPRGLTAVSFRLNALYAEHMGDGPLEPRGYHAVNLFLHLLVGLSLYVLAKHWLPEGYAALAAALCLLHPLQSETVAYLAGGRAELIAALGTIWVVWAALQPVSFWSLLVLGLGAIIAVGGKELGVMALPLAAVIRWQKHPPAWSWRVGGFLLCWVLFFLGLLTLIVNARILGNLYLAMTERGAWAYAALQASALWTMLRLLVMLIGQNVDHDVELTTRGVALVKVFGIVLMLLWAWRQRHNRPALWMGVCWMGILLGPRFVVRISEYLNEHQVYGPFLGMWIAGAAGVQQIQYWFERRLMNVVQQIQQWLNRRFKRDQFEEFS